MDALATFDDLEDMWRPLADSEMDRAFGLLGRASALLRQAAPSVDDRIAAWRLNPADPRGLDPTVVATVVATIVKRFISNVEGIASQSTLDYSVSYALRTEKAARGELQVTSDDLRALFPDRKRARVGTIRVRPALAARPVGRYGPRPSAHEFVDAVTTWHANVTPDATTDCALPSELGWGQ